MNETNANTTPPPPPPPAYPVAPPAPPAAYPLPTNQNPNFKAPALAGVLSLLPGLGHVYLGLYQRALTFFLIWVALWAICDQVHHVGPFWLLIPFWWFFVLIDAVQQSKAINATGVPEQNIVGKEIPIKGGGSLFLGVLFVLLGGFFLIKQFVTIDLSFLWNWSPLLLVAFGAWQIFSYYKAKTDAEAGVPRPSDETGGPGSV